MKKYRNNSKYPILEQGKVFLVGQAHELPYAPASKHLTEEVEFKEEKKPKKDTSNDNPFSSLSAEDLKELAKEKGIEYTTKPETAQLLFDLSKEEDKE